MKYHYLAEELRCLNYELCSERSKYYSDIITFDIESTSLNKKTAFMYVWQMCINGTVFYGRYWEEFQEFIQALQLYKNNFVIWIHNLSFEFSFIQDLFIWENVFAVNFHKPIYAKTENVIFRCSYLMSNLSLDKLAENYDLPVQKLVGDLDYSLIRHPETPLTEQELAYCENDVLVLYHYIKLWLGKYGSFSPRKMPYTSTGYTRMHLREKASESKNYKQLRDIVQEASPRTLLLYHLMQRAFAGGYAHASYIFCKYFIEPKLVDGKKRARMKSRDKTSFYPSLMVKEKYPRKFFKIKREKYFQLIKMGYAVIADVCFKNIRAKGALTTISEHKCALLKNEVCDNGRVYSADILVTSITELDLDTINKVYDYDSISIGNAYAAKKRYLPKVIVECVLDLYEGKTVLKDVEGKEQEYQRLKALLNSLFGMSVTDIMQAIIIFLGKGEWTKEEQGEAALLEYIKNPNSILLYQTGIYITAYARHELLEHDLFLGDSRTVYNDTDSVKYLFDNETEKHFEEYNQKVWEQLLEACSYHKIDPARLSPKDIKGHSHPLGMMSDEGEIEYFKTLGAKRYVTYTGGKLSCTVAGVPKKKCAYYLTSGLPDQSYRIEDNPAQGAPTIADMFYKFSNQMFIPAELSGKNTHYYTIPSEDPIEVTDYLGNKCKLSPGFGVSLIPQPFEINLSAQYKAFLCNRITVEGVSHCERLEDLREFTKIKSLWEDLNNGNR